MLWRPVLRRIRPVRWLRLRPIIARPRPWLLRHRAPSIGKAVRWRPISGPIHWPVIRWRAVAWASPWPIHRRRRPVIRRPIAPVPAVPGPVPIRHRTRPVNRMGWSISPIPPAPRSAVVINLPSAPIPTPSAPTPRLVDEQGSDADRNPKGEDSGAQPRSRIDHCRVVLRQVNDVRVRWLDHINRSTPHGLHIDHLLGSGAQRARRISLGAQPLD